MSGLKTLSIAAVALGLMAASANATTITSLWDDFDSETAGLNATLTNWNITSGSIDVISQGGYGINCAGASGKCLDMDGTTSSAGTIETKSSFMVGTYKLTFDFRGNDRNSNADSMTVIFGDLSEMFSKNGNEDYTTIMRTVTLDGMNPDTLSFAHAGGDNIGLILDNVHVQKMGVPEPGTLALFGLGLAGLGFARRRLGS